MGIIPNVGNNPQVLLQSNRKDKRLKNPHCHSFGYTMVTPEIKKQKTF